MTDNPALLLLSTPRMRGPAVRRLQELLAPQWYAGPLDGIFGPRLEMALRAYQIHANLTEDGVCGPETWEHFCHVDPHLSPPAVPSSIVDLRGKHPRPRLYGRKRRWQTICGVTLHQTGCAMPRDPWRWTNLNAHFGITRDGIIVLVNDPTDLIWHANGLSPATIGIEIAGNFCGLEGDRATWWQPGGGPHLLNDRQCAAAVTLLQILQNAFREHDAAWIRVYAHRQASRTRVADPGSRIWQAIAIPWIAALDATSGPTGYTVGTGLPIPVEWDPTSPYPYGRTA